MSTRIITAATAEALTLDEARDQLRITHTAEDYYLNGLIPRARELFQARTGHCLMPTTYELTLQKFAYAIELKMPPIISITSVKYTDVDGAEQTLASTEYVLDNTSPLRGYVVHDVDVTYPDIYTGINGVRVRYQAGYATAALVPGVIKQWMLMQISNWFNNRQPLSEIQLHETNIDYLIDEFRNWNM